MFLLWKKSEKAFQFQHCFTLNFGYHDTELSIQQIALKPNTQSKIDYDSSSSCFFVIIGGKYLNMVGDVMEKVNNITNDVGGINSLAVFIISNSYKENLVIDVDYGFERSKHFPVMVTYQKKDITSIL